MEVTYNGERAVRVYNLDWEPGESKEVADDLSFANFSEFKVGGEKPSPKKSDKKSK